MLRGFNSNGVHMHAAQHGADLNICVCMGMSFWKRRRIAQFFPGVRPLFTNNVSAALRRASRRGGQIAVWSSREPVLLAGRAAAAGVAIVRVEDGFLRSAGLGADFVPGASITADCRGVHYDPARPSDLEVILEQTTFDTALRQRASRLIARLVARGITKYDRNTSAPLEISAPGRLRIFVPGQVENDQSVLRGSPVIRSNLELLARVRAANPYAYIVYKPHPDVEAGHRTGALTDAKALRFADRIVRGISSAAVIAGTDEVHTLTSLAGFEALMRVRKVVTYGQPFYAGWGLTTDLCPPPRRKRRLALEELVAGALILYPRYLDPVSGRACPVEDLVERLEDPTLWRPSLLVRLRRLQGALARPFRHGFGAP